MNARRATYYAAALSALTSPLWVNLGAHGWRTGLYAAWFLSSWYVFVWHSPREEQRP